MFHFIPKWSSTSHTYHWSRDLLSCFMILTWGVWCVAFGQSDLWMVLPKMFGVLHLGGVIYRWWCICYIENVFDTLTWLYLIYHCVRLVGYYSLAWRGCDWRLISLIEHSRVSLAWRQVRDNIEKLINLYFYLILAPIWMRFPTSFMLDLDKKGPICLLWSIFCL